MSEPFDPQAVRRRQLEEQIRQQMELRNDIETRIAVVSDPMDSWRLKQDLEKTRKRHEELLVEYYSLGSQTILPPAKNEDNRKEAATLNTSVSETSQPRVFISHSSKDKDFVRKLTSDLKAHNLAVWFDEQELGVGDSIVQGVSEGLKNTDYFILVISQNSLQSKWVQQEFNSAMMSELSGKGVVVLPIRIDDASVPPLLTDRIYADFRTNYDKGLEALLRVFKQESVSVSDALVETRLPPCGEVLKQLTKADLRRRLDKKLNIDEVKVVWFDTFEDKLDDQMPNQPKSNCIMEMIDRASRRGEMKSLLDNLCASYKFLANPR